jgi:type VI secretion system protein ImpG
MFANHNPNFSKFLPYYQEEIEYLLSKGKAFAGAYPSVAKGLDLGHKVSSDPHVERLLESFAFLSARLQLEIDDQYTFMSTALLDSLYPQFVRPTPSFTVAQLNCTPETSPQLAGTTLPQGTEVDIKNRESIRCSFRTTMPCTFWPFTVVEASYENANAYDLPILTKSSTLIRLKIKSQRGAVQKSAQCPFLRFYLGGNILTAFSLFQWLHTYDTQNPVPVFIRCRENGPIEALQPDSFESVGFDDESALIQDMVTREPNYRFIWEYFQYPQKFLFFDIKNLSPFLQTCTEDYFTVFIPLQSNANPSQWPVSARNFQLNCVPLVNLFFKTTEPIRMDHEKNGYRLIPDQRLERGMEIHSISHVSSTYTKSSDSQVYEPYFSYSQRMQHQQQSCFWLGRRTHTSLPKTSGTDVILYFVDYHMRPVQPQEQVIYAHTLCTNRRFAESISIGEPLTLRGNYGLLGGQVIESPSRSFSPDLDGATQWKLINQLAIDQFGFSEEVGGLKTLKGLLSLYHTKKSFLGFTTDALQGLTIEKSVGRIQKRSWKGFVPMLLVQLVIDDLRANNHGVFLLSMILSYFFRNSAIFNTLVKTEVRGISKNHLKSWESRECTSSPL